MTRRLVRRERAKRDIIELVGYIADDSPEAAARLLAALESTFQSISHAPGIGAVRAYIAPTLKGLRVWPVRGFPSHLIFYQETADTVDIVRVLHARRDIGSLFRVNFDR